MEFPEIDRAECLGTTKRKIKARQKGLPSELGEIPRRT
jgi:hypothetical protein